MARRRALIDLVAGVAGATALIFLVFGEGLAFWLAIPFAIAAYLGVRLLRPPLRTADIDQARELREAWRSLEQAKGDLQAIRQMVPRITSPEVRQTVRRIVDSAERLLVAIQEDEALPVAKPFAERITTPCAALLTEYIRLSGRGVVSAVPVLARIEQYDFELIQQEINQLYEEIHRRQVIDLAVQSEMIELNREISERSTPRRIGP